MGLYTESQNRDKIEHTRLERAASATERRSYADAPIKYKPQNTSTGVNTDLKEITGVYEISRNRSKVNILGKHVNI